MHSDTLCRRCWQVYDDHLFLRNRRRCDDGRSFMAAYWTQEEIDAAKERAAELLAQLEAGDPEGAEHMRRIRQSA